MAAKHDGKQARANHWVMQQNLAKQKGGRPLYQPKPKGSSVTKGVAKGAIAPIPAVETKLEASASTPESAPETAK